MRFLEVCYDTNHKRRIITGSRKTWVTHFDRQTVTIEYTQLYQMKQDLSSGYL